MLLASLDDLSLALSYVQTALELLAHGGILGVEAGGQAGKAHIHEVRAALSSGACGEGARGVDDVVVGQVEALGPVTCGGGHVGRVGFLLHDNLVCWAARPA